LIARRLEIELSKQRILELYLNVIEWGDGIYGAEAAARTYFRKSAADLGPYEAALLAGALPNPRVLTIARPTAHLRRRQQIILSRMGAVTPPPVVADAVAQPATEEGADEIPAVPALPPEDLPATLPGEPVPAEPPPPVKPCAVPPCR
jgi:monofunctional biosynthetic peptidoglycan transglycosylase